MNENELESLLKGLRPHAASPTLEHRVERDLVLGAGLRVIDGGGTRETSKPAARWWQPVAWAGLGAAAAVFVMTLSQPAVSPNVQQIASVPVNSIREVIDAADQGVSFNSNQLPERHVKLVSMERHQWIDPRDGAQMSVEIPREDTLVLPVSFQ